MQNSKFWLDSRLRTADDWKPASRSINPPLTTCRKSWESLWTTILLLLPPGLAVQRPATKHSDATSRRQDGDMYEGGAGWLTAIPQSQTSRRGHFPCSPQALVKLGTTRTTMAATATAATARFQPSAPLCWETDGEVRGQHLTVPHWWITGIPAWSITFWDLTCLWYIYNKLVSVTLLPRVWMEEIMMSWRAEVQQFPVNVWKKRPDNYYVLIRKQHDINIKSYWDDLRFNLVSVTLNVNITDGCHKCDFKKQNGRLHKIQKRNLIKSKLWWNFDFIIFYL